MSSVLNSVFKGRKGKKHLFHRTHRAQSPPSPGSFVSPETSDKPFNPYALFEASQTSLNQHAPRPSDTPPAEPSKRVSSPRVNVEIGGDGFSLSDWLTSELIPAKVDAPVALPERNVSLGVKTGAGSSNASVGNLSVGKSVDGGSLHHRGASGSAQSHTGSQSKAGPRALPIPPRVAETHPVEVYAHERSFSEDEVIVIGAPRGRNPTVSPLSSARNFSSSDESESERAHGATSPQRPTPAPLKIPEASVQRQRAASLESGHPDKQSNASVSPLPRHPSLTRSRSRLRSRPGSLYSRYSDTDIDYDDNLNSAVSGTTLARALVSPYVLSPSSSFTSPSPGGQSYGRTRGHLARQDSATLPRGELPFTFNRKSLRSSKGSLAPSSRVNSNYWRDRRISGDQIVVVGPEERDGWGADGDVPPVPPVPAGLSPEASPYSCTRSRKPSPNPSEEQAGSSSGLTAEWRHSIGARRSFTDVLLDSVPDKKRRRISRISEASGSQASTLPAAPSIYPALNPGSNESLASDGDDEYEHDAGEAQPSAELSGQDARPDAPRSGDVPVAAEPATSSQDTPGYDTPALSQTDSATSAESSVHTPASAALAANPVRTRMSRSYSESSPRRSMGPRPVALLPIGERPRSQYVQPSPGTHPRTASESMSRPFSMTSPLQPPVMPAAAGDSPDSPDLLDIMFAGSRVVQRGNGSSATTRVISPPAPISVPPPTSPEYGFLQEDPTSPSTASSVRQTFPETPYAFTPLVSAGFTSPQLPRDARPPSRWMTTTKRGKSSKAGLGQRALMRHATMMSPPTTAELSDATPMTPPLSGADAPRQPQGEAASAPRAEDPGVLAMIEETASPVSPPTAQHGSQPSSYAATPEHSPPPAPRLSVEATAERTASLVPAKRSLTPLPSPPLTSVASPSHPPSPVPAAEVLAAEQSHRTAEQSTDASRKNEEQAEQPATSIADGPTTGVPADKDASPSSLPPPVTARSDVAAEVEERSRPQPLPLPPVIVKRVSGFRGPRSRPPPPSGPRRPSGTATLLSRSRNGSVSSSLGSPPSSSATTHAAYLFAKPSSPIFSASSPRFETQPVKFRGFTLEAAQWTWKQQQLQEVVSAAIKKSASASSIRLLTSELLNDEIPAEVERLEALSAEIRTNYKLAVRKRRMIIDSLRSVAGSGELAEQAASGRLIDDLEEVSDQIDHYSEELYAVTDQLSQLRSLQDVHYGSALAMALRKLNNAFLKHLEEKERLRQQVAALEAERNDAWQQAQEAARELDELNEKIALSEGIPTPASSRRSSKVSIARKASLRKAGLRSPSRLRSQHSSIASTMAMSPGMRTTSLEDVPPVPPIPVRSSLAVSTSDLPSRSSGVTSEGTPLSEIRAIMQQAHQELCEMLGINPEDLQAPGMEPRQKRSLSLSATMQSPRSSRPFLARTVSESHVPSSSVSASFGLHRRSRTLDDSQRQAVLSSIGMAPA